MAVYTVQFTPSCITPYWSDYFTLHHYIYTDASGAEYRLDVNSGNVWRSKESIYIWYDAATTRLYFRDGTFWLMGSISAGTEQDAGTRPQRRNYSKTTTRSYLQIVRDFGKHFNRPPDQLGPAEIRTYQAHLLEERKLEPRTVGLHTSALRFLFVKTLKRPYPYEELPYPKRPRRLPIILSQEEAARLIESASNLFHRAMLMTLYSTGVRRAELCRLKVEDIDGGRMVIHIRQGKGGKDRDLPLDPKLRETLREYYRWMQPKTYLFPGTENGWRADKPITTKVLWEACRETAQRAGITKRVSPHLLRHSFATHLIENGADLPTVQTLLGHADLRATSIHLHLSQRHLKAAGTPLDKIEVTALDQVKRSRKLHKKPPQVAQG